MEDVNDVTTEQGACVLLKCPEKNKQDGLRTLSGCHHRLHLECAKQLVLEAIAGGGNCFIRCPANGCERKCLTWSELESLLVSSGSDETRKLFVEYTQAVGKRFPLTSKMQLGKGKSKKRRRKESVINVRTIEISKEIETLLSSCHNFIGRFVEGERNKGTSKRRKSKGVKGRKKIKQHWASGTGYGGSARENNYKTKQDIGKAKLREKEKDKDMASYLDSIVDSLNSLELTATWKQTLQTNKKKRKSTPTKAQKGTVDTVIILDDDDNVTDAFEHTADKNKNVVAEKDIDSDSTDSTQMRINDPASVGIGWALLSEENDYKISFISTIGSFWKNDSLMDMGERIRFYSSLLNLVEALASYKETLMTLFVQPPKKDEEEEEEKDDEDSDIELIEEFGVNQDDGKPDVKSAQFESVSKVLSQASKLPESVFQLIQKLSRSQAKIFLKTQTESLKPTNFATPIASAPSMPSGQYTQYMGFPHLFPFMGFHPPVPTSSTSGSISSGLDANDHSLLVKFVKRLQNLYEKLSEKKRKPEESFFINDYFLFHTSMSDVMQTGNSNSSGSSHGQVTKRQRRELLAANTCMTLEERRKAYVIAMNDLKFKTIAIIDMVSARLASYQFIQAALSIGTAVGVTKDRIMRISRELSTLSTSLPVTWESSVFVRADQDRPDILSALIIGPEDTPYANGAFIFDILLPAAYPNSPPKVILKTTGGGTVRFNPNLYANGKVCLSLLGTWSGPGWDSVKSTLLQVLISIQSLIMVPAPYFNEPGYEQSLGTPQGESASNSYNREIVCATLNYAILEHLKNPPKLFEDVLKAHFTLKGEDILTQCESWKVKYEPKRYEIAHIKNRISTSLENLRKTLADQSKPSSSNTVINIDAETGNPKPEQALASVSYVMPDENGVIDLIDDTYDKQNNETIEVDLT